MCISGKKHYRLARKENYVLMIPTEAPAQRSPYRNMCTNLSAVQCLHYLITTQKMGSWWEWTSCLHQHSNTETTRTLSNLLSDTQTVSSRTGIPTQLKMGFRIVLNLLNLWGLNEIKNVKCPAISKHSINGSYHHHHIGNCRSQNSGEH